MTKPLTAARNSVRLRLSIASSRDAIDCKTAAFSHCKFKLIAFLVDDKENVTFVDELIVVDA